MLTFLYIFGFWTLGAICAWAFIYGAALRGKEYDETMQEEYLRECRAKEKENAPQ